MKKITIVVFSLFSLAVLQNCSSSKKLKAPPVVSFSKDVMPILQASCTPCHFPPEGRKEALNTYDAVKKNFADILTRVKLAPTDGKFMPWKSKKPALTDSMINVLAQWEKQSMPQ
jgi:hypothetical protein